MDARADRHAANWQKHMRLDPDLKAPLEEWAKAERRSVTNLVNVLLAQAIERRNGADKVA